MKSCDWDELTSAAQLASAFAYAPYSQIRVGAALRADSGQVYTGCNVENPSFGLTTCAERVALQCAIAQGERNFKALAIFTPDANAMSPCGACRQVLAEFAQSLPIISVGRENLRREFNLADLLPEAFSWPAGEPSQQQEV